MLHLLLAKNHCFTVSETLIYWKCYAPYLDA